ncbi:DUF6542 domain-containing protein [Nocardioides acrostichi]|uniref:DUF6542 domain-containing protein n=1 Tax=Nocardioides acrostichi TaxID=2784339 RepID=A0A930V413_9ACTN|nr:DUF6542 domain-containing protein [Nocardioides acrostichi]MBF4163604.1 hypothetical protein [Nocardioides acrostichi]
MSQTHAGRTPALPQEAAPSLVVLALALLLTAVAADGLLSPGLGRVLDVGFLLTCLAVGLLVRHGDFFVAGVLPPLALTGVLTLVALTSPGVLAGGDTGWLGSTFAGLAHHSTALVLGWVTALVTLLMRDQLDS